MAEQYIEFAKADIRLKAESAGVGVELLRARLCVHRFIEGAISSAGVRGGVAGVLHRHFLEAEEAIVRESQPRTAYIRVQHLEAIGKVIDDNRLTQVRIGFRGTVPRPLDGDELTDEGQLIGAKKMVSPEALAALAAISADPKTEREKFIIRIVDLLVVGGFRIGEVLTLPVNCWVEESSAAPAVDNKTGSRNSNCGISYLAEKAREYRVKWLPRCAVELARRAVTELAELCRPAREVAAWMEDNPGRLKAFEDLDPYDEIDGADLGRRLGFTGPNSYRNLSALATKRGGRMVFNVGVVEREYIRRGCRGDVLSSSGGRSQLLSESLIVAWENMFSPGNRPQLRFLPTLLRVGTFTDALCPSKARTQVKGLLSSKGMHVRSHQFRHWLNTIAANEGLSDVELALWMGRRDLRQNAVYKHGTLVQRTNAARQMILSGQASGPIARTAASLPVAEREGFVNAMVESAHATEFGLCVHPFAASPCHHHHQCLRGCGDYLRVKGDQDQRLALLRLKATEEHSLAAYRGALSDGIFGADRWIASAQEHLIGINAALAVDELGARGEETKVFPESQTKLKLL